MSGSDVVTSTDQIRLEKAKSQPEAFGLVFQKSDGQLEIHQSLLLDQITREPPLPLLQVASMNLLFVLAQKRDDFAEHMIPPLILMALRYWGFSQNSMSEE